MPMISRNMNQAFFTGGGLKSEPIKNKSQSLSLLEETALLGIVITSAALLEVSFIPGVLIGGAAILAPKYLNKHRNAFYPLSLNFKNKNKRGLHCLKKSIKIILNLMKSLELKKHLRKQLHLECFHQAWTSPRIMFFLEISQLQRGCLALD